MNEESGFDKLVELVGLKRKDNAAGVFAAQATLANQQASDAMANHARRVQAVQDAYWKCRYGDDYEPPEEEVGHNFVNCSIVSDQAVARIADIAQQCPCPETPAQPVPPTNGTRPKWWRVVLATLAAVIIGGLLVFLVAQYFLDAGDPAVYEIIATNEPFTEPEPFTGEN